MQDCTCDLWDSSAVLRRFAQTTSHTHAYRMLPRCELRVRKTTSLPLKLPILNAFLSEKMIYESQEAADPRQLSRLFDAILSEKVVYESQEVTNPQQLRHDDIVML